MNSIKIAFFGNPDESVLVVDKIHRAGISVVSTITKTAQPVGRNQKLIPTSVAVWSENYHIPCLTFNQNPQNPWEFENKKVLIKQVLEFQPNLLLVADFTLKIPQELVQKVKYGGLNIHPSLLPTYRGPAPVPWQILNGETETGVSIVTLAEEFDAGQIIAHEKEPLLPTDTTPILLTRLFTKGAELLIKTLPNYINQLPNFKFQISNFKLISYYPRLTRADGFIPWEILVSAIKNIKIPHEKIASWPIAKYFTKDYVILNSKFLILNSFRAFHPWPGIWTKVKLAVGSGQWVEKRLKILKVHLTANRNLPSAILIVDEIQLEGKSPISGKDTQRLLEKFMQSQPLSE